MNALVLKKNTTLIILLFINFLFAYKYIERITNWALPLAIFITFFSFLILNKGKILNFLTNKYQILLIIVFCICSFFIWKKIPVENLNVDRWSVITSFWDTYFSNTYAYFAKSNVGNPPGPMPFYYILALPFYFLKELGYLPLLGIIFFYSLLLFFKVDANKRLTILLFTLSSFFNLWEVISRSNIFFNSTLILVSTIYILKQEKFNTQSLVISSILIGLTMSTRNVFVLPYIVTFIYILRKKTINFKQFFILGTLSIFIFCLTFLPIIYNHLNDFLIMNPFIVQSTFLIPFEYTILFILLAFGISFLSKNAPDVYFYSGLILFLSIFIYFVYHILHAGFHDAFFNNIIDISYFILCTPFLLWYYATE